MNSSAREIHLERFLWMASFQQLSIIILLSFFGGVIVAMKVMVFKCGMS